VLGGLGEFLRFDGHTWGNKRGYVWSRLLELYKGFPLFRKMIGTGSETIEMLMQTNFGSDMVAKTGMNFDNAHNELLQYLITQGLLGLLSYLLFVGSAIRDGFKKGERFQKAAALCGVCYLAQSVVNISQAITTPLFFVILALAKTNQYDEPSVHPTKKAAQNKR
jgi:O-antigen ligase